MLPVLGYTMAPSTELCLMGIGLERIASHLRWPRRSIWTVVLVGSIAVPFTVMQLGGTPTKREPPPLAASTVNAAAPASQSAAPTATSSQPAETTAIDSWPRNSTRTLPRPSDDIIIVAWLSASAVLIACLLASIALLHRRMSLQERATVLGVTVLVTDHMGPALFGAWRPRIIVPRWFLAENRDTQWLILSHELQHRAARDPLLLWLGVSLAVLVPWNLPLWWQLRRLRLAVEFDCDARVVSQGAEPLAYGQVLLTVTRRSLGGPVGTVAMSKPASALEERIMILEGTPERYARLRTITVVLAGLAAVGAVTAMDAPPMPAVAAGNSPSLPLLLPALAREAQLSALGELALKRAAERYPQLVQGPQTDERYVIALLLGADGTLQNSEMRAVGDRDVNDLNTELKRILPPEIGQLYTSGSKGAKIGNGQTLRAQVSLIVAQKPAEFDESRSLARVHQIVRAKHDDLMRDDGSGVIVRLTVFLTEAGQIERENIENPASLVPLDYDDPELPAKFAAQLSSELGVDTSRFGAMGFTIVEDSLMRSAAEVAAAVTSDPRAISNAKRIMVYYAWPRRPGESGPYMPASTHRRNQGIDLEATRVLVEHYIPDAFTVKGDKAGNPTLVMDSSGKVIRSGRVVPIYGRPVYESLEKGLMPEYKRGGYQSARIKNARGESAYVWLFWQPDPNSTSPAP